MYVYVCVSLFIFIHMSQMRVALNAHRSVDLLRSYLREATQRSRLRAQRSREISAWATAPTPTHAHPDHARMFDFVTSDVGERVRQEVWKGRVNSYARMYARTCTHAMYHSFIHARTHARVHAHMPIPTHTYKHTLPHPPIPRTHTYKHTHTRKYTHAWTRMINFPYFFLSFLS